MIDRINKKLKVNSSVSKLFFLIMPCEQASEADKCTVRDAYDTKN